MSTELSTHGRKDLVRGLYKELYENANFDAVGDFYAADAVRRGGLQGDLEGRDAIRGYLEGTLGGLSDVEVTELHCLCEGDIVAYDFEMSGTHSDDIVGVPATGNRIDTANAALFRIEDGRVAEEWARSDVLGFLTGIGAVELPF